MATRIVLGSWLLLAACGGDNGTGAPPPVKPVAAVLVSPSALNVLMGQNGTLTAQAKDASGSVLAGRTFVWSSSAPAIATVSTAGVVTGVAVGTATVSAASEGQTGTATITVSPQPTTTITPVSPLTSIGTAGFPLAPNPSVKVVDQDGAPAAGVLVTFAVASGGGSVTGGSQTTNLSGIAAVGSWTLGSLTGANTLTATVVGLPPVLFTATGRMVLSVAPAIAAAAPNVMVGFTVRDQVDPAQTVVWRVNGISGGTPAVGTVSASGQYSAPATIPPGDSVVVSAVLTTDATVTSSATVFFVPDLTTKDYYVPIPRVVDLTRPAPTRFLLVPPASATSVTYVPVAGPAVAIPSIGNGVLSFEVSAASATAGYQNGTLHNVVGFLDYRDAGGNMLKRGNLSVNVRDATMPDVTITTLAADAQRSPYVLNLRLDMATNSPTSVVVSRTLQLLGGDQFDFVAVIATVTTFNNRYYLGLRNDVGGIGLSVYDNSVTWGGTGRLRGVINYPIDSYFDGAEQAMIHEMGHAWINFASTDTVLASGVPHWPASTMALGAMGFSIPGSGAGGAFPWSLTPNGVGTVRINRATASDRFTPLDLYVMGLLPPDSVPVMYVLPATADPNSFVDGMTSAATSYTIADYIASQGVRTPASTAAPRAFATAVIVLTYGRLMTRSEMAFFDAAASRAETSVALRAVTGLTTVDASGFFLATGGRATLRTRLP